MRLAFIKTTRRQYFVLNNIYSNNIPSGRKNVVFWKCSKTDRTLDFWTVVTNAALKRIAKRIVPQADLDLIILILCGYTK